MQTQYISTSKKSIRNNSLAMVTAIAVNVLFMAIFVSSQCETAGSHSDEESLLVIGMTPPEQKNQLLKEKKWEDLLEEEEVPF